MRNVSSLFNNGKRENQMEFYKLIQTYPNLNRRNLSYLKTL